MYSQSYKKFPHHTYISWLVYLLVKEISCKYFKNLNLSLVINQIHVSILNISDLKKHLNPKLEVK